MAIGNQFYTNIYQYIRFPEERHASLGSMLTKNVDIFDWASFKPTTCCPPFKTGPESERL